MKENIIRKFEDENRNIKKCDGVSLFTAMAGDSPLKQGDIIPIQILKYANRNHPIYGKLLIDEKYFTNLIANFNSGVKKDEVPVNKEHDRTVAQAWIKKVYAQADELRADIELTADGAMNLDGKHYKYFSAEIADQYQDPDTNKWYNNVLVGGAFTNYPYFNGMEKIVASDPSDKDIANDKNAKKLLSDKTKRPMNLPELLKQFSAKESLTFAEKVELTKAFSEASEDDQKNFAADTEATLNKFADPEKDNLKAELDTLKAEKKFSTTKELFSKMHVFNQEEIPEEGKEPESMQILKIFSKLDESEVQLIQKFFSKFEEVIETLTNGQLSKSFSKKASKEADEGEKVMSKDGKKEVVSQTAFTKLCKDYAKDKGVNFNKAYEALKDDYEIKD